MNPKSNMKTMILGYSVMLSPLAVLAGYMVWHGFLNEVLYMALISCAVALCVLFGKSIINSTDEA